MAGKPERLRKNGWIAKWVVFFCRAAEPHLHTWLQKSFCQLCIGSSCGCETRHLLVVEMGKGSGPKGSLPADAVPPDVVQEQRGKGQERITPGGGGA